MSVIAEFDLDSPILRGALTADPDARASVVEETVPSGRPARIMFWCETCRLDAFERGLREDATVEEFVNLTATDDSSLYRITIAEQIQDQLTYVDVVDLDGTVLAATGTHDGWRIRVRFPDREAVAAHREACDERGVDFTLQSIYTAPEREAGGAGLTDSQRRTLELALERGYFDIPRGASLADLGDELDVSSQAISERLRRAFRKLATDVFEGSNTP